MAHRAKPSLPLSLHPDQLAGRLAEPYNDSIQMESRTRTFIGSDMHLSYAGILARRVPLSAAEAAALVLAACRAVAERDGREPNGGCPSPDDILLNGAGQVRLAGWCSREEDADVRRLAELLQQFLIHSEAVEGPHAAVPGALLLLIARAVRTIDLPVPTLAEFTATVGRFGSADTVTLARLFRRAMVVESGDVSQPLLAALPSRQPAPAAAQMAVLPGVASMHPATATSREGPPVPQRARRMSRGGAAAAAIVAAAGLAASLLFQAGPIPPAADTTQRAERSGGTTAAVASDRAAASAAMPAAPLPPSQAAPQAARGTATDVAIDRPSPGRPSALLAAADVGADVFSPSFTESGRVLFHAGRTRGALMQASFESGGKATIAPVLQDEAANFHGSLSPGGQWLAFDSDRHGTRGVYVSQPNGGGADRVSGDGYAVAPRWSPDGRTLAFVKAEAGRSRVWNVWTVEVPTRSLTRVSRHAVGQAWGPSWFPDGQRLAYSVEDTLVIVDVRSGRSQTYRSPVRGRLVRTPAVSPDGRRIVFQVFRNGVWMLDLASGRMQRVLSDATAEEFAWTPAGDAVAYHARVRGTWSIWRLPLGPATS